MIEIKITGYTLQECIEQITGKIVAPAATPVVSEEPAPKQEEKPVKTAEPVKAEEPVKAAEPVKEEKPAPVAKAKAEEPVKAAEPGKEEKPAETKSEDLKVPTPTRDDCFNIATEVKNKKKIGALRLILAEFGANKFSEVKEADYPALYEACEKRLAQED